MNRAGQLARVAGFFNSRPDQWIPLYELLELRPRIAQLNTRIHEARHQLGLRIRNATVRRDGETHSFYILLRHLSEPPPLPGMTNKFRSPRVTVASPAQMGAASLLFRDPAPERHRDDG